MEEAGDGVCPEFATLREWARRFPALELTLVARTLGYFATVAQPDPAQEAERLRRWLHEEQQLPGALAVTRWPFRRLPAPDRRVLYQLPDTTNETGYPAEWGAMMFLVDREGRFVATDGRGCGDEEFAELIAATLRQRPRAGAGGPAPRP